VVVEVVEIQAEVVEQEVIDVVHQFQFVEQQVIQLQ
jgi:hypothetical protein